MTEQVTDNRMGAPVGPDEGQEVYDLAIIGAGRLQRTRETG